MTGIVCQILAARPPLSNCQSSPHIDTVSKFRPRGAWGDVSKFFGLGGAPLSSVSNSAKKGRHSCQAPLRCQSFGHGGAPLCQNLQKKVVHSCQSFWGAPRPMSKFRPRRGPCVKTQISNSAPLCQSVKFRPAPGPLLSRPCHSDTVCVRRKKSHHLNATLLLTTKCYSFRTISGCIFQTASLGAHSVLLPVPGCSCCPSPTIPSTIPGK